MSKHIILDYPCVFLNFICICENMKIMKSAPILIIYKVIVTTVVVAPV